MARRRFPEVSVKLALVAAGRLLVLGTPDGGHDLPGGHLEYGESLLGALRRELREEIGWTLRATPELFWVTNFFSPQNRRLASKLYADFFAWPILSRSTG